MSGGESSADAPVVAYPVYPAHAAYVPPPADVLAKYGSAHFAIKIASYPVGSLAPTLGILDPVANIPGWNPNALVEKIVEGPPGLEGKWIVRKAVASCGPERFARYDIIQKTVNATTIEKYPSRDKFEMAHNNVSLVNFCTISIPRTNLYHTI